MQLKKLISYTLLLSFISVPASQAAMLDYLSPANPANVEVLKKSTDENLYSDTPQKAVLTQNALRNQYEIAHQRFMQANVKSAYMDFRMLIKHAISSDFAYLKLADSLAEMGLFNLSNEALNKVSDKNILEIRADDLRRFYFPKVTLTNADEIYLAEIYSNIMYNAQSKEATAELAKNTELLNKYDYANYIAALGSLKTGNLKQAFSYIENALKVNPNNVNYQKLKIEVLLQQENYKAALKVLENIKKTPFYALTYSNKVNVLEQYSLYKSGKNDIMKKYYLANYYKLSGDDFKAIRTLQSAVSSKKNLNRPIYGLMADIYFNQKEYEKAQNFAEKSVQLGGKDTNALLVLGKINLRSKNYKESLKYFKTAGQTTEALTLTAKTYSLMGNDKSAKEIYSKILKEYSDCPQAYYNMALMDKERRSQYLKKAVALDINYMDGWLELAKLSIDKDNLQDAGTYLSIVKSIDENDFRYYYYQGLVYKAKGLHQDANYYFKKSLALNPDSELVKKELGI